VVELEVRIVSRVMKNEAGTLDILQGGVAFEALEDPVRILGYHPVAVEHQVGHSCYSGCISDMFLHSVIKELLYPASVVNHLPENEVTWVVLSLWGRRCFEIIGGPYPVLDLDGIRDVG